MQSQSSEDVQPSLRLSRNAAVVGASNNKATFNTSAPMELMQRLLAVSESTPSSRTWAIIGMLASVTLLAHPGIALADHLPTAATTSLPQPIADLAENEDFWANVLRYISFYFSVLLGTAYVAIKPIIELLKRPTTAILVIIGGAALYFFVSTTVGAMLGMNDIIDYEPSSIVTPMQ